MNSFTRQLRQQWQLLSRDPWLASLLTWIPLLLFVLLWAIMAKGIARDLPIGVVDLDRSRLSRSLIRHYDASSVLAVSSHFVSVSAGERALRAGEIYALVLIPENLEADTMLGRAPQVSGLVNSQFLLIGRLINSALAQTHGTFAAGVEVVKGMAGATPVPSVALANALPIGNQITPLFNTNTNYAQFLLAAMLPAMWQILMIATTVLALATWRRKSGAVWPGDSPVGALLALLLLLACCFWLQGGWFLLFLHLLLGYPMHGSWTMLLLAQGLTALASVAVASFIYLLIQDAARALSMAAAYAAPGLAFMGVTFPVSDMTLPARIWRSFLPISHYSEVQLAQVNYGASILLGLPQLGALCLFLLLLVPAVIRLHRMPMASEEVA